MSGRQMGFDLVPDVGEQQLRWVYNKNRWLQRRISFEECLASDVMRQALTMQAKAAIGKTCRTGKRPGGNHG